VREGTVRCFGLDPWADPVHARRKVGWMSDDMPIWVMSIGDLLTALAGFYPSWDPALATELCARLELDPKRMTHRLSKGEHTRIRLVITLAFRPELVLLDEPATGLDVPARRALLDLVLGVVRDGTRTVVLSPHQVDDVERVADRVILLETGRIVGDGTAAEVAGEWRSLEERLAARPA
jgi:ABC-2 type transport system ATP-binding protein